MTSYSVLPAAQGRASIIGTWPGFEYQEHSVKVTTVATADLAHYLAMQLTRLSEAAWDAAMWLDTYPAIETAVQGLVARLRAPLIPLDVQPLRYIGLRHGDTWTARCLERQLSDEYFVSTLNALSTAQKVSIADELEADAGQRRDLLEPGKYEFETDSRVNQAGLVTRVEAYGASGPVPEGAAAYMREFYGEFLDFGERWEASRQLRRMEQLVAACEHHGGRAHMDPDTCEARCVVPAVPGQIGDADVSFSVQPARFERHAHRPFRCNPSGKLRVRRGFDWVAELDPHDTNGFARVLGGWAVTFADELGMSPAADHGNLALVGETC